MIVIVPHRDLELKLINSQKKLIRLIFKSSSFTPYAAMPLWIPTTFETVEQAKKEIKSISVLAPEYDEKEDAVICPVKIETTGGECLESKLEFIHCHCEKRHDATIHTNDKTFPLPLKIFRLGECTSPSPNVYELASTVWKKLT